MKILAFDTTSTTLSVALLSGKQLIHKNTIYESGKQSEFLVTEIEKALKENNIWYQDLDLIATTNGPGSFTGVRIGLSVARAIKIAINTPLILLDSCEVVAYKYQNQIRNKFVILDAKANEFFCAYFSSDNKEISSSKLVNFQDLAKEFPKEDFILCGSGKEIAADLLQKNNQKFHLFQEEDIIEADLVGKLAYEKYLSDKNSNQNLNPQYLRQPKIEKRKK